MSPTAFRALNFWCGRPRLSHAMIAQTYGMGLFADHIFFLGSMALFPRLFCVKTVVIVMQTFFTTLQCLPPQHTNVCESLTRFVWFFGSPRVHDIWCWVTALFVLQRCIYSFYQSNISNCKNGLINRPVLTSHQNNFPCVLHLVVTTERETPHGETRC